MAIKLVSKTNTNGITGTYPYGSIRDEVSPGDGTPVDTQVYGDFHQFFARMAALAGITLNDLPDNNTNGFQYNEAFKILTHPDFVATGLTFATSGSYSWANSIGFLPVRYKISPNQIFLSGVAESGLSSGGDIPVMTLPAGARPASDVFFMATLQDGAAVPTSQAITIDTSGVVTALNLATTLGTYKISFEGVSFRK